MAENVTDAPGPAGSREERSSVRSSGPAPRSTPTTASTPGSVLDTANVYASEAGAVHRYQTEASSTAGSRRGSTVSRVAPRRSTDAALPAVPATTAASSTSSFAGRVGAVVMRTTGAEADFSSSAEAGWNSAVKV